MPAGRRLHSPGCRIAASRAPDSIPMVIQHGIGDTGTGCSLSGSQQPSGGCLRLILRPPLDLVPTALEHPLHSCLYASGRNLALTLTKERVSRLLRPPRLVHSEVPLEGLISHVTAGYSLHLPGRRIAASRAPESVPASLWRRLGDLAPRCHLGVLHMRHRPTPMTLFSAMSVGSSISITPDPKPFSSAMLGESLASVFLAPETLSSPMSARSSASVSPSLETLSVVMRV